MESAFAAADADDNASQVASDDSEQEEEKDHNLPAFDGEISGYESLEAAHLALNRHARKHGYAVILAHTRHDKSPEANRRRGEFKCDRHGQYKPAKRRPGAKRRTVLFHQTLMQLCISPKEAFVTTARSITMYAAYPGSQQMASVR
jgi:hypothetical protein